jgi:hypothetical protein
MITTEILGLASFAKENSIISKNNENNSNCISRLTSIDNYDANLGTDNFRETFIIL